MRSWRNVLLLVALLAHIPGAARSQDTYPQPTGFVNDYASVLTSSQTQRLTLLAREIKDKANLELAFVTMDSIPEGQDISLYSVELAHNWGVGTKGSDRGALLLYKTGKVDKKRQVYLATGYGLEGDIPDARAGRILDQVTVPRLKQGKVYEAFVATAVTVTGIVAPDVKLTGMPSSGFQRRGQSQEKPNIFGLIVMIVLVGILMSSRTGRAILFGMLLSGMFGGRRGGWGGGGGFGGGGFGGGFGGFGGGGFGGGGAGRSF